MARFENGSAFCPTCQKRVLTHIRNYSTTPWLVLGIITCGFFLLVWLVSKAIWQPQARCSQCGTVIKTEAIGVSKFITSPAVITAVCVFIMLGVVFIVLDKSLNRDKAEPRRVQEASLTTTQTAPSPLPPEKKGKTKNTKPSAPPKQTAGNEGYRIKDEDGSMRGYALTCWRQADELGKDIDFRARNFVFERCIELEGDGVTAKRELVMMLRQAQE